jgi:hypothetical protein
MTYRYMRNDKNEKTLPLWAALGAPLVGVPLMVGLLAIAAPKQEAPAEEPAAEVVVEPVDSHAVTPAPEDGAPDADAMNVG